MTTTEPSSPGAHEDGFTSVGGLRVHWEAWGQGEPLVLVHGLGAAAVVWRRVGPLLARAGYRALALDLKGCGLSAKPRGDYSRRALAALVLGFMDALGVRRARGLVGHSMGGAIALEIAAARPERLDALAVVDGQGVLTSPRLLAAVKRVTPLVGPVASGVTALAPLAHRRFFAKVYLRRIFGDKSRVTDELVDSYAQLSDAAYQRSMFAMLEHLGDTASLAAAVPSIRTPSLLVWGGADPVCPPAVGRELAAALPDAELHVLPGVGHTPAEERPDETAALLVDFLARRTRRA